MGFSDEEVVEISSQSSSPAREPSEARDQPRHLHYSNEETANMEDRDMTGETPREGEEEDEGEEDTEEEEEDEVDEVEVVLSDSDSDSGNDSHVKPTQSETNTTTDTTTTTRATKPKVKRRRRGPDEPPPYIPKYVANTFRRYYKTGLLRHVKVKKIPWDDTEYSDSDEDGYGYGDMDHVAADVRKYRGLVAAYLEATPIYDVSIQGALQRVLSTTGYGFDEEEQEELVRMIRSMLPTLYKRFDTFGEKPSQHLADPMVLWYTKGVNERQKMRVRLEALRQQRKKDEIKSMERRRRKKEKREKKRREKGKKVKVKKEEEEVGEVGEQESATIKTDSESLFAQQLLEGYTESFEGVEFYYPAVEDLSDCELLEETPAPAPETILTEEMNLAEMIRDSYKVSVEFLQDVAKAELSRDESGSRDELSDDSGSHETDLRVLFQKWISQARSKWAKLDVHVDTIRNVDIQHRADRTLFQIYRPRFDYCSEIHDDRKYHTDRTLFSIPTPERTATLEWFERDWGLSKAAQVNHYSTCVNSDSLKPVPVYLVDSNLETEALGDPGLTHMFEAVGGQEFDQDAKTSDPFATRTYYLTDELYAIVKHRLLRHRDVIYSLFKYLVGAQDMDGRQIYFHKDRFLIGNDKLHAVFSRWKQGSYISWAQASKFLFKNHYFITPGCAIRPVDPIFYSQDAHEIYRENRRTVDQVTSSSLAPMSKLDKPHKVMTFNAVASTGEVWKRHDSPFYGFRDPTRWEVGLRKWAGAELQGYKVKSALTDEERQEFIDRFNDFSERERRGKLEGDWWVEFTTARSKLRTLPRFMAWPRLYGQLRAVDTDQLANLFHPTWYAEWRRPWQRNLGYTFKEMHAELQVLREISEVQEGTKESHEDDRFVRYRGSRLLETDFYPPVYNKPFKATGSWHFMAPKRHPHSEEYPQTRKRPYEIDSDNPWDQTLYGSSAGQVYDAETKPAEKPLHYNRTNWHHPKRRKELDGYHFEHLYGRERWGDDTFKVQEPKQVYLCFSDDSEDEREWQKEQQERVFPNLRKMPGPTLEEVDDEFVEVEDVEMDEGELSEKVAEPIVEEPEDGDGEGEDVQMGGYDFGPTVEEVE